MELKINDFAEEVYQNSVAHGFWKKDIPFASFIALCHGELSESLSEYLHDMPAIYVVRETPSGQQIITGPTQVEAYEKPEGSVVELADTILRIICWLSAKGVDIESVLEMKHNYNKGRPYMHDRSIV